MAKKNNQQDEQVQEMLDKALGRYRELLLKVANSKKDETTFAYEQRFFTAMQKGTEALKITAKKVADIAIPNFRKPMSEILQSYGANYSGEELNLTVYSRMVSALNQSVEKYRDNIAEIVRKGEAQGEPITVADLREIIGKDLQENNVAVVEYKNGANMPLEKYVGMVARSARAETANLVMIQQALREGIDLVECDTVFPTCDICAVYQGRVYSISGKDSRYPALYKTAFKSGYSIIHPNCRHSWAPYHVELYTDEELEKMRKQSNRSWQPDGDGKAFQQTEKARAEYARGQQLMRQWNAEILEYEKMKAYYKSIGEEPPYKTLGGFRRAKRAQSTAYTDNKKEWSKLNKRPQNHLTNESENNIIKENSDLHADYSVDWSVVNTKAYQDTIISLIDKKVLGKAVYKIAKTILEHRQNTKQEDLFLVDARTGAIVYQNTTSSRQMGVEETPELVTLLSKENENGLIIVHNHPKDGYPSSTDFNALYKNHRIKYGIIVGHKGTIYKYTAPKQQMQKIDIDAKVVKLMRKGWTEQAANEKTYKELENVFGFTLEVIKNGNR